MPVMLVRAAAAEHQRTGGIHGEADHRNNYGKLQFNVGRLENTVKTLGGHDDRKRDEQNGAGKPGQGVNFAGAERKPPVVGMPARKAVGKYADHEGRGMRGHVQAVRQQGHRTEREAGRDFHDHGNGRNHYDDQCAPLPRFDLVLAEAVVVKLLHAATVHGQRSCGNREIFQTGRAQAVAAARF